MMHIEDIATRLKEIGQDTIAITEHGNLYSNIEAFSKLSKEGIKVINGCEVYICGDVNVQNKDDKYNHLILLSKNEVGRQNLNWLISQSTLYRYYGKPRIDFNMLKEHHDGLVCLSACMAGEVSRALMNNDVVTAKNIALKYKELFGEDYYIEYQSHDTAEQQALNQKLIKLALSIGVKFVVTSDAHYLRPEDEKYHSIFIRIGTNREVGEVYTDCYLQSEEDVRRNSKSTFQYTDAAIATTHEIADKCENTIPLSAPIIPHFPVPEPYKSEAQYLKFLCNEGMKKKGFMSWDIKQWNNYMTDKTYNDDGTYTEHKLVQFNTAKEIKQKYLDRARYEMRALEAMGFEGYYLMVYSYVNAATRRGIARGSGGGSLLAYLCGIVDIDPIKYGLYFERFIDVGAIDLLADGTITKKELKIPDFDVDFSPDDREKVIQYVINKYGEDNVVSLGQFQYLWAKGAIKDIGKVLGLPFELTNEITKNLDDETIDEALNEGVLDAYKDRYPELFEYASKLSGLPKSFGVHPCIPAGELVMTDDGYKTIENIQIGDNVLTHTGAYKPVIETMSKDATAIYTIKSKGAFDIKCTGNHPFYVRRRLDKRKKIYSEPEWVDAKCIKHSDMICIPVNKSSEIPIFKSLPTNDNKFWWIVGRYISDGWCEEAEGRNEKCIKICCEKKDRIELHKIINHIDGIFDYQYEKHNTTYKILIKSADLFEYLQKFGKYAYSKKLCKDVFNLPTNLLKSFIEGYLSADGCYSEKDKRYQIKTVSKELANGIVQCVAKAYHTACGTYVLPSGTDIIDGRSVNRREKYVVHFQTSKPQKASYWFDEIRHCLWCCTKDVSYETIEETVYNLSVLDDNSYTVNNIAVHNCGRVISIKRANYYNATEWNEKQEKWVLQGDMHSADDLGLVKADFLGLRTLDVIYDVLDMIGEDYNYIAPHKLNMNDPKVWAEFSQGHTDCIFQFESKGMKQMLKDMKCNRMDELSAANALYRPGSKEYIPNYVNRKNGIEPIEYLHSDLEPILKISYGIIVFQEQLIEIGRLAGLRNPDELRQATAKKKPKLMAKIEPELKNGLMLRGWTQGQVDKLWQDILKFAKYSFNKSHSSAYGITAYITMYLKVYHTNEFFTACINSYEGAIDKIVGVIKEAKRMNVDIKFDKWQKVTGKTMCHNNTVWLGVDTMRGFGKNVATALQKIGNNHHSNFIDFLIDVKNTPEIGMPQLENLIKLDWFKEFGSNGKLLRIYELFNSIYGRKQYNKNDCPIPHEIIASFCKETAKQYREVDSDGLLKYMCNLAKEGALPIEHVLKTQNEIYGYYSYINPKQTNKAVVLDINTKYNTFKVQLYNIAEGSTFMVKIKKNNFEKNPFMVGSVLSYQNKEDYAWQYINDEWQRDYTKKDLWLNWYELANVNEL